MKHVPDRRMIARRLAATVLVVAVGTTLSSRAEAQQYLSEAQAHAAAVDILIGEPYGNTVTEVSRNLRRASLIVAGSSACGGAIDRPVWSFHVLVEPKRHGGHAIEGTLDVDAMTGELACAGIPYLN